MGLAAALGVGVVTTARKRARFGDAARPRGMRILAWLLVVLALVTGCSQEAIVAGPEIPTVNTVIGDASFVATYGRAPTLADDPTVRVRTHLAYVEAMLRAKDVSVLSPAERAARTRTLDNLRRYWERGEFPASDAHAQLLPTFVDDTGVRCAVAFLAEQDIGAAPILEINQRYRNAYIAQIDAPALVAWAETSGLTPEELSIVQPAYPPRPKTKLDYSLTADFRYAVDDSAPTVVARGALGEPDPLGTVLTLRGGLQTKGNKGALGEVILGVTGGLGWAGNDNLAYDAHLRVGDQVSFGTKQVWHRVGAVVGVGLDAVGERIERAVTVPVDMYYFAGHEDSSLRYGLVGGPRFALTTDRGTGWRAGLAVLHRDFFKTREDAFYALRDIQLDLGVERMSDVTFVGLSLTLASRSAFGWWDRG